MRKTCLDMVYTLAQKDERVAFIGSDLSPGLLADMKAEFPTRYFMEGVSEQSIIGMSAGMAMDGFTPFVNTIATFITRRCYEQVALDLCLHDLPVRLIANGGGLVYAPLGPTHLAIEDIAIMRALPNMAVTVPSDADEITRLMEATVDWPHPIYIRMGKGGDPIVSEAANGFEIGKAIVMSGDAQAYSDVLIVSTGVLTARVLEAAAMLETDGLRVVVLHVHTIKPLDEDAIRALAGRASNVVVVEEHFVQGGLGTAVAECLSASADTLKPVLRIGIPDRFPDKYGNQDDLLAYFGLDKDSIHARTREYVNAGGREDAGRG